MSVINTNITSMIAQQNLNDSKGALETNMERLSSGLRINSAKDDAAGQAIANRFEAQTTGLGQAQRNANDGISVAQTAEGALDQINDNVQRVRELTVQAANGTNSEKDLTSIQDEIGQRLSEIDRISEQTDFNGTKVLDEGVQGLDIQVGANDGETITVNLEQVNSETLNLKGFTVDGQEVNNSDATKADLEAKLGDSVAAAADGKAFDYTLTTQNQEVTGTQVLNEVGKGNTVDFTGNTAFGTGADGDTFTADGNGGFNYDVDVATSNTSQISDAIVPDSGSVSASYDFGSGDTVDVNIDSKGNMTRADSGADLFVTETGELTENSGASSTDPATVDSLTAAMDLKQTTDSSLTMEDGTTIKQNNDSAGGGVSITNASISAEDLVATAQDAGTAIDASANLSATTVNIDGENDVNDGSGSELFADGDPDTNGFDLTDKSEFSTDLYVGEDGSVTDSADGNGTAVYTTSSGDLTFNETNTEGRTADPLETLDNALNDIDSMRSDLGAIQNRFESAITNLSTNETNLSDAQSRIEDVDYASEVAEMTKNQILQQAGTSVLAQANQLPQNALSLLG